MTFHIFRNRNEVALENNGVVRLFANEGAAIDAAVRTAQANNSLYSINYYRP